MARQARARSRAFASALAALISVSSSIPAAVLAVDGPDPAAVGEENVVPLAIERSPLDLLPATGGGAVPDTGSIVERITESPVDAPSVPTELPELRNETSRVIANPDGTYTADFFAHRINYADETGAWQPIDLDLVDEGHGHLHVAASDIGLRLATDPTGRPVAELTSDGYTVRLHVAGAGAGTLDAEANQITYPLPGGGTLALIPVPEGVTFTVAIDSALEAAPVSLTVEAPGLAAGLDVDGQTLLLTDPNGAVVSAISPPRIVDANDQFAPFESTVTTLDAAEGIPTPSPTVEPSPSVAPSPSATPEPSASAVPSTAASGAPSETTTPAPSPAPSAGPAASPAAPSPEADAVSSGVAALEAPSGAPSATPGPSVAPSPSPSATESPASPTPSGAPEPSPTPSPTIPPPTAFGGVYALGYTMDPLWLAAPERAYPVVLDPTICIQYQQNQNLPNCDSHDNANGYVETFVMSGAPDKWQEDWTRMRIGTDDDGVSPNWQKMRGLFFFPNVTLPDGAQITQANFRMRQTSNYGAGTQEVQSYLIKKGWSSHATWDDQPAVEAAPVGVAEQVQASTGLVTQDVTDLVRLWYTRNTNDWKPNLGLLTQLVIETQKEVRFHNMTATDVDDRPQLRITYIVPKVAVVFDSALGPDFVPTTMPVGATVKLPVKVKNTGGSAAPTFNKFTTGSTDYYRFGYRWFDTKGEPVTVDDVPLQGTTDLPENVAYGETSTLFDLEVTTPPQPGHYSLRLDLVHVKDGDSLWASDWASPSKYYARAKYDPDNTSSTRWVGTSVIERDDFGVAVTDGAGDQAGELRMVDLADGTSVGINVWSRNLRVEGTTGLGWDDLGLGLGLDFQYDSRSITRCAGILRACGWTTTYDEHWEVGANGADYIYQDAAGNRHLISSTGAGQLVSSAAARLERTRVTLVDERALAGWTGTAPTSSTAEYFPTSDPAGSHSYRIGADNTAGTETTTIPPIDLDAYPRLGFAVQGNNTSGAAIGFKVRNEYTDEFKWIVYTVGTDFSVPGGSVHKIALGGSISSWNHVQDRALRVDAAGSGLGDVSDRYSVTGLGFWGKGGSGFAFFDAVRFEGSEFVRYDDAVVPWTANGANASRNGTDKLVSSYSMQAEAVSYADSPRCIDCFNNSIVRSPFMTWSWKKVGGTTIAHTFHLRDDRTNATGAITYYAGPTAPAGAPNPVQVASEAPNAWVTVTRNLLDDVRQTLGWYKDYNDGGSSQPTPGPVPDPVFLTGFRLLAVDGKYGLFDKAFSATLTDLGADHGDVKGSEYLVTLAGGERHEFDQHGNLTRISDTDGHAVTLDWSVDFGTGTSTLLAIHAPSDGMALSSGTADRQVDVSSAGGVITFTETLDGTGRSAEFTVSGQDLVKVRPARQSAACGATGCLEFGYDGTSHRVTRIDDPRENGTNNHSASISYSGSDPTTIRNAATGKDLLRVWSYGSATSRYLRPKWQDADGIVTGTKGYARYADLSPNGSVLVEYRPVECTNTDCASGTAPAPADKLVEYETDGINGISKVTRYRLTGDGGAVVTRRGSFAAAAVDNYADPITGSLTAWTQSEGQYAASSAPDYDDFRTTYAYGPLQEVTSSSTPYTNPGVTNGHATQTLVMSYDREGHLVAASDNAFLANTGFENALVDWTTGTGVTWEAAIVATGSGAVKMASTGSANQTVQLVPGQTVRFQLAARGSSGTDAQFEVDYEKTDATWANLLAPTTQSGTSYVVRSFDLTIPADGTGRVKVILKRSGTNSAYFDDLALMTGWSAATYIADGQPGDGLLLTETDAMGVVTRYDYAASSTHPAIYATTVTDNYDSGQPATNERNVASTATFDAWGRTLTTTDPDGVTVTTTYAANKTDIASVADELGNTTEYTYDAIGQQLTVSSPLDLVTQTEYDYLGNPTRIIAPDLTETRHTYDGVGRLTATTANHVDGTPSGAGGIDDLKTTFTLDEYGQVTRSVADAGSGLIEATTDTTYDLFGQVVSATVYTDGISNPRSVTTYFDGVGRPVATRGPVNPSGAPAPVCPGDTVTCNSLTTFDLNGRATKVKDVYGVESRMRYDFAGHAVYAIASYQDGVYASTAPDEDLITTSRYDSEGRVVAVTTPTEPGSPARTANTTYDALGRVTQITNPDSSWTRTVYTAAGRVDRASGTGASGEADADVSWSKSVYDKTGRQTATLGDYDISGKAQLHVAGFENKDRDGFVTTGPSFFIASGASDSQAATAKTGRGSLQLATTATQNQGASLALTGDFVSGRTYKAVLYVKGDTSGQQYGLYLGHPSGSNYAETQVTSDGTWQRIEVSWTPSSTFTSGVVLAFRANRGQAQANTVQIDDAAVWDNGSPERHAPSLTVYDADSRPIASVLPPGKPGDPAPTTLTAYDEMGRITSVTANHVAGGGTGAPDINVATSYEYDDLGRQTRMTADDGVVTGYAYDRLGRLTDATLNQVGQFTPGPDEDVRAGYAYDDLGQLVRVCAPTQSQASCDASSGTDARAWHYTYDKWGNLSKQTPPVNQTLTHLSIRSWTYDAGNRLTSFCDYPDTASSCTGATREAVLTHDKLGRLLTTEVQKPVGTEKVRTTAKYDATGARTQLKWWEAGVLADTLTFTYDDLSGRQTAVKRSTTTLTGFTWNPDGTLASRSDDGIGSSGFGYDRQDRLTSATSPVYTGSATFGWRLDGLIASRGWPTGNTATFTYDALRRAIELREKTSGGADQALFTQTYDRVGQVTSEARTITGISGAAGTGAQDFTHDALRRVRSATIAGQTQTYTYDASGNRTSVTRGGVTTAYTFDRADQLKTKQVGANPATSFAYDAYGNLTTSQVAATGATAYTYDAADRLASIDPPGASNTVGFTFDALGRNRTRSVNGVTVDTYGYLGESEAVVRLDRTVDVLSAIDAMGDRLAISSGSSLGWTLPDLHGSMAAIVAGSGASVTDAFRYDPYGEVAGSVTSALPTPWRYQGNLLLTEPGTTDLYENGARSYDPGLGAFTQLDSVMGSAQHPLSLNRYLYAWANPTGMIDPSGHYAQNDDAICPSCGHSNGRSVRKDRAGSAGGGRHRDRDVRHRRGQHRAPPRYSPSPVHPRIPGSDLNPNERQDHERIARMVEANRRQRIAADRRHYLASFRTQHPGLVGEAGAGRADEARGGGGWKAASIPPALVLDTTLKNLDMERVPFSVRDSYRVGRAFEDAQIARLQQEQFPESEYELLRDRNIRNAAGESVRINQRTMRPDAVFVNRASGRIAGVYEFGQGTTAYLRSKVTQVFRYQQAYVELGLDVTVRTIYEEVPARAPRMASRAGPLTRLARGGNIALFVLSAVGMWSQAQAERRFWQQVDWLRVSDPAFYRQVFGCGCA